MTGDEATLAMIDALERIGIADRERFFSLPNVHRQSQFKVMSRLSQSILFHEPGAVPDPALD